MDTALYSTLEALGQGVKRVHHPTLGGAPGPWEQPHIICLRPKLKGCRPTLPYMSGHLAPSGTSPGLSPACPACLHKALSIGSRAGSHKPHPQLEMKPELWMLGAVCQPDSWHCHLETWASAPGVGPHRSGRVRMRVSPGQLTGLQPQAGAVWLLQAQPSACGLANTLSSFELWLSKSRGPPTNPLPQ